MRHSPSPAHTLIASCKVTEHFQPSFRAMRSFLILIVVLLGTFHKSESKLYYKDGDGYRDRSAAVEPPAADSLSFLVLGDWGGRPEYPYTTPAEVSLAKVMGEKAADIDSSFTLALGDNFYDTGVKNAQDKRFTETFEVVYTISYNNAYKTTKKLNNFFSESIFGQFIADSVVCDMWQP